MLVYGNDYGSCGGYCSAAGRPDMRIEWKRVVLLAVLAGFAALVLRGFLIARCAPGPEAAQDSPAITVYDHREQALKKMDLETYIMGVTAAEMPASFPLEALKAQAVAARTYTVYHMLHNGCKQHDADVCTSSACCQAYCDDTRMREKWGSSYKENKKLMAQAVDETLGQVLLYDGEPIEALYHSASGGRTENVEDIYGTELPYLRSVMSSAEAGTSKITGEKTVSLQSFCDTVNKNWKSAGLTTANAAKKTVIEQTTQSGRVQKIRLGDVTATGRQVRSLFSLDSALFTITFTGNDVVFRTKGYGHGVGMSQTGANVMALGGSTYDEILHYYYTDVEIGKTVLEGTGGTSGTESTEGTVPPAA